MAGIQIIVETNAHPYTGGNFGGLMSIQPESDNIIDSLFEKDQPEPVRQQTSPIFVEKKSKTLSNKEEALMRIKGLDKVKELRKYRQRNWLKMQSVDSQNLGMKGSLRSNEGLDVSSNNHSRERKGRDSADDNYL
jgi:hypothetical protein